jgi:hypothetical protein
MSVVCDASGLGFLTGNPPVWWEDCNLFVHTTVTATTATTGAAIRMTGCTGFAAIGLVIAHHRCGQIDHTLTFGASTLNAGGSGHD